MCGRPVLSLPREITLWLRGAHDRHQFRQPGFLIGTQLKRIAEANSAAHYFILATRHKGHVEWFSVNVLGGGRDARDLFGRSLTASDSAVVVWTTSSTGSLDVAICSATESLSGAVCCSWSTPEARVGATLVPDIAGQIAHQRVPQIGAAMWPAASDAVEAACHRVGRYRAMLRRKSQTLRRRRLGAQETEIGICSPRSQNRGHIGSRIDCPIPLRKFIGVGSAPAALPIRPRSANARAFSGEPRRASRAATEPHTIDHPLVATGSSAIDVRARRLRVPSASTARHSAVARANCPDRV